MSFSWPIRKMPSDLGELNCPRPILLPKGLPLSESLTLGASKAYSDETNSLAYPNDQIAKVYSQKVEFVACVG